MQFNIISKKIYKVWLLAFLIFSLFSCSWFNNNETLPPNYLTPGFVSFTITGNLGTNGAMPENFAQVMNSRTAIATVPEGKTIQYKVLLLNETGTAEIAGASSQVTEEPATHELSYIIQYIGTSTDSVKYKLRAVAFYMDGTDEVDILVSPDTQLDPAVDLKGSVFTKDLEMRPATTGAGTAELTITLQTPSNFTTVEIDDTTHFELDLTDIATGTIKIKNTGTNIVANSYPVTVSFYNNYDGYTTLVYQFNDIINIFNNLKTTVWVDNGNSPHLTTNAGVTTCNITDAKLLDFNKTNFYVDNSLAALGQGTFSIPFNSLYTAINYINAFGNNTTTYTIHIKGDNSGNRIEYFGYKYSINKRITLESYLTAPGKKDGIFVIEQSGSDSSTVFEVGSGGVLTFDSNGQNAGISGSHATKGIMIKANDTSVDVASGGKFVMKGGRITAAVPDNSEGRIYLRQPAVGAQTIFEMSGGAIEGFLYSTTFGLIAETGATIKLHGKPYIYNNTKNLYLNNGTLITVDGPFIDGALIGVTTATPPTATPVTITTGYGYQNNGYNAGKKPGKFFRGDVYGVTDDGDPNSGEAVLAISGGSISTKVRDDITIDIDHTNASNNAADRKFTFTVTKDKGAVAPAASTNLTSAEGISYSYKLRDRTDTVINPASPASPYYSTSANTLTLNTNLPSQRYKLEVEVTWEGNKYQSVFDVSYLKVDVPSGCVAVMGDTWNSSTTLCAGDTDRQSKLFIANRHLDIPDIIASDHEVTQTEWKQYMIIDPTNTTYVVTENDLYPIYYIDWYPLMVYCNLRTLDDSTFGSTREERLSHCVYSLNGTKDPELWLNSLISGTRIYKSGEKFYFQCYGGNPTGTNDALDPTTTSGYQFDLNADGWRIPTAVEWEYLARGGNLLPQNQTIYSGSDSPDEVSAGGGPYEIRFGKPNSLNLYDMSGNLSEWCWDYADWENNLAITTSTPITGRTDKCEKRFLGSSGKINGNGATYAKRGFKYQVGFRVIRTVKQ